MRSKLLLFSNVPADCSDDLLSRWIEARGYRVLSIKLIRDLVSGTSPSFAHVQLADATKIKQATRELDGQAIHGRRLDVGRLVQPRAKAAR